MNKPLRRLQKIKGGSFIISLPSEWVRQHGLSSGSELLVYNSAGSLRIVIPQQPNNAREIELTDLEYTKYLVSSYYMQGVSQIRVYSKGVMGQDQKRELRGLQLSHAGLQVEEEGFDYIKFGVRAQEPRDIRLEVEKFGSQILQLIRDLARAAAQPTKEMCEDIYTRCDQLLKSYRLIIRTLALGAQREFELNLGLPTKDIILYAVAARDLGRTLTHIKHASQNLTKSDSDLTKFSEMLNLVGEMFGKALRMFLTEQLDGVQQIRESMKKVEQLADSEVSGGSDFAKSVVRLASYSVALMDDAVHKSIRL
ncbi:MAG: phosphate uptake regulator PhoU [Thermoprotei archaeon]